MNTQNQNQISVEEKQKLVSFLYEYAKGELEGEERKIIDQLECEWDTEDNIPECTVLVERQEGDPKILPNGSFDWKTLEDITDYGRVIIKYIAQWKGTLILFKLFPDLE